MISILLGVLKDSLEVVATVLIMMVVLEYLMILGVPTRFAHLKSSFVKQLLIAIAVAIAPGCMGGYALVSLYAHGTIGFAALLAGFTVTLGDESFLLLSLSPWTAVKLWIILSALAVLLSLIAKKFMCSPVMKAAAHIQIHHEDEVMLHSHWIPTRHFWVEHVWGHIIKKHAPKLLAWTVGTLLVIHLLETQIDLAAWVNDHLYWVLFMAMLIGIIPESGPHIIFITLFVEGTIPFSILLASSLVQDGHSGLPLLAEDRKSFVKIKLIKLITALILSTSLLYFGL